MARKTERRDSKGRVLRSGEYQRADGRYEYRYTDPNGTSRSVYSWQLVAADYIPKGRRKTEPLREMIKKIQYDNYDGISTKNAQKITLNEMFDRLMSQKQNLAPTTLLNQNRIYNKNVRDDIGKKSIGNIKYSDIKAFYNKLLYQKNFSIGTIEIISALISAAFKLAVRDGLIRTNPCSDQIRELKKGKKCSKTKRTALTREQQTKLIEFIRGEKRFERWALVYVFLLGTGCRVSEAVGLQWKNVDFENEIITIDHQVLKFFLAGGGVQECYTTPKTSAGIRKVPMLKPVKDVLEKELERQKKHGFCTTVLDGESGFVFVGVKGDVITKHFIEYKLDDIVDSYNLKEKADSENENREPVLLPKISPHILRHTFCTRLIEENVNVKVVQSILGHSNISVTLDVYTDVHENFKKDAFEKLNLDDLFLQKSLQNELPKICEG